MGIVLCVLAAVSDVTAELNGAPASSHFQPGLSWQQHPETINQARLLVCASASLLLLLLLLERELPSSPIYF